MANQQEDPKALIDQAMKAMPEAADVSNQKASAKKDLSKLPTWNCRVEGKPKDQQWTVGEVFILNCEGPTTEILSTKLSFKEEGKSGYELRVLKVDKLSDNALIMQATSYVPTQHNFNKLFLLDQGTEVVKIEPFALSLKSVIKDPKQKLIGPIGPIKMAYPTWLWVVLASIVLITAFWGVFRLSRRRQMRKVIEELKQHNTALGPFNQFNKDVRTLGRQYIFGSEDSWSAQQKERYIESLDEVFRMYLLREFFVPALDWNTGLTLKTISKQDKKRYGRYGQDLQKFLKELDRARAESQKLRVHDCKQLTQMAKKVTQEIWKVRKVTA